MTAVIVVLPSVGLVLLVGLIVTIAAAILVAHWGSFRPQAKRIVAVSLTASLLTAVAPPPVHAEDEEFVVRDSCQDYEPWSLMWIVKGCMLPRRRRALVRRPR